MIERRVLSPDDPIEVDAGTKESVLIRLGDLPNGAPYLLPVMVVHGKQDGPTLFLNATMHGDEVLGSDVVRRTVGVLEADDFSGILLAVPMANHSGVATRSRRNVVEMYPGPHDMNRVFPGNTDGVMTERIASFLMERFVAQSDFVFDLHSASVGGAWKPYALCPPRNVCPSEDVFTDSRALAEAFGSELLLESLSFQGSLAIESAKTGVPSGLAEFGVANRIDSENRKFGMRGVDNLLKHLDMIPGEPESASVQVVPTSIERLRVSRGGFLILKVDLWDQVSAGDVVAEIEDLDSDVIERILAPIGGRICRINTMGVVGTGDIVAYIGEVPAP